MKKLISLLLVTLITLTTFGTVGCVRGQGEQFDANKTQLFVGVMSAGMGTIWSDETIEDFEEFYKDQSFEPGKTGVQVIPDYRKDEFVPTALRSTMKGYRNAIYYVNQSDYDGYIADDLLVDITETINEKVYDENGDLAAESGLPAVKSMMDTMKDVYVGRHERGGKYYAIPWCEAVSGIVYDADLFDEYGYYFKKNGQLGATYDDVLEGNCGAGPDGKMGTTDDGMPATYADFIKLCTRMATVDDVIPFTWAGTEYQRRYAFQSIWANYEGYDDYMLNYTMNGKDEQLGQVTEQNYNTVLAAQEGRLAAIQTFADIIKKGWFSGNAFKNTYLTAQTEYIYSKKTNDRIAFFMEGGYWEAEGRATSDTMSVTNPNDAYGKRNFKLFPIPNFVGVDGITDQTNTNEPEVLLAGGENALVFLTKHNASNNPEVQLRLAKLFLQFANSRKQLVNFTRDTGACFRCFDFEPTPAEKATFTKFTQSVYSYIEDGSKLLPKMEYSSVRKNNSEFDAKWVFTATVGGTTFYDAASAFKNNPTATPAQVFNALKTALSHM
jgi:ABC-type glycerol-3-phosphate transport system substrate-binding protein